MYEELEWKTLSTQKILETRMFDVFSEKKTTNDGACGQFVRIDAPDWVVVIAKDKDDLILVRQYRHGVNMVTLELPGGIVDGLEAPETTATRELKEETGFISNKVTYLGTISPNTALFSNRFHVYLCEELEDTSLTDLDEEERIEVVRKKLDDVIDEYGSGQLIHPFMGTALMLYLRHVGCVPKKCNF